MESAILRHLRGAIASGEVDAKRVEPKELARTILTAYNGAMILWAIRGKGALRAAVGSAIDAVVRPYRTTSARSY